MDKLNELENIWQAFKPNESEKRYFTEIDHSVLERLKKTEKKHSRINIAKTVFVAITLGLLTFTIWDLLEQNLLVKIALAWIILSLTVNMYIYWKKQFYAAQFDFIADSKTFVESTINKLKSQKKIITHLLPIMASCLVIGINLMYFDLLKEETIHFRIIAHLSITVMLYVAMFLGLIFRKRRFNNDFKPLIDELETIHQNLKKV